MKLRKIELLSRDELLAIHNASLELLASTGIKIESHETIKLFEQYGAERDFETGLVKLPEYLVRDRIKSAPHAFTLHGVDPANRFEISCDSTTFATIGTPVRINDPASKKGVRDTVIQDTINQIRVVDALPNIVNSHVDVWPNDVPYTAVHVHLIYQWARNAVKKPYGLGCFGRLASQDMIDMTADIVGGKDELVAKPRLVGFFNTSSPMHLPQLMTNGFGVFARHLQPTIIAPEALAGSTAPVSLAGLLVQANAEVLASVVFAQLTRPGAPVFYGTVSNVSDPRTGNSSMGSIETGLITAGVAQLARFYNIPSRGPGCVTDSKCFDIQNGTERMHTLMLAVQAGINYITCAGTYEATLAESLELLVIDDELAGMTIRMMDGIEVNVDTLATDVIKGVITSKTPGKSFLGEKHTRQYMRRELFIPALADRDRRGRWYKNGARSIIDVAADRVKEILAAHQPRVLDPALDARLQATIKRIEQRTIDEYRAAEGLKGSEAPVPGAGRDE